AKLGGIKGVRLDQPAIIVEDEVPAILVGKAVDQPGDKKDRCDITRFKTRLRKEPPRILCFRQRASLQGLEIAPDLGPAVVELRKIGDGDGAQRLLVSACQSKLAKEPEHGGSNNTGLLRQSLA